MLNSHKCSTSIVQFVKAAIIVISVHLKISNVVLSPEQSCPFNRGYRYKDYVDVFPGPNFVSPEWRCPLNRGVSKEKFHCIQLIPYIKSAYQISSYVKMTIRRRTEALAT